MDRFLKHRDAVALVGLVLLLWSFTSFANDLAQSWWVQNILETLSLQAKQVEIDYSRPREPLPLPTLTPFKPVITMPTPAAVETLQPTIAPFNRNADRSPVTATASAPTPTDRPQPMVPDRIVIPSIQLDAPVVPATNQLVDLEQLVFTQWQAPEEYAAGWETSSAKLGAPGNTVLDGHHNEYGEVFGRLVDLSPGDIIQVYSGSTPFNYVITNKMILPERDQPLSVRLQNARWLSPSNDERLTLITCWPRLNNTHRLIIVARPVQPGATVSQAVP